MFLSIFLIFGAFTAKVSAHGRIVGGEKIDIKYIPYQLSLIYRGSHICGASLLSKAWAMTAAHCTSFARPGDLQVRAGSSYQSSGGQVINVTQIVVHPDYNSATVNNDYSLLKLEDWEPNGTPFGYVELPEQDVQPRDNSILRVSGWGETQSANESMEELRIAEVNLVNWEKCHQALSIFNHVTDRMMCAGLPEGGRDACQGDSGGPLVRDVTLVGIVSWGLGCGEKNFPGVYARVSAVVDWTRNTTTA